MALQLNATRTPYWKGWTPLPLLHSFPPWMTLIGQTLMCSQVHTALCISSYLRCQWWRCADYHWRVTDGSRQTDRRRIKGRKGVLSYLVSPEIVNHFLRGGWWFLLSNTMYWIALRKQIFRSASITMTWSPCVWAMKKGLFLIFTQSYHVELHQTSWDLVDRLDFLFFKAPPRVLPWTL